MCGIAGIASLPGAAPPTAAQLFSMCQAIAHRGPDDEAVQIVDNVGFGVRRLSVIDPEGGQQPVFNEGGSIRAIFNGEIYNYRELRRTLEADGHVFRSHCDSEVIVHAYERYKCDFVSHLNGMFAIALHDVSRNCLYLMRDHIGVKPLYYAIAGNHLVWGSEIKALLASGMIEPVLDVDAFAQFMSWEYIPGSQTPLRGIHRLLPGSMLRCRLDQRPDPPRRYWDIPVCAEPATRSAREWEAIVDDRIRECVRRQLVSDVPLGAFLSGGVDSSTIVSAMGTPTTAFSVGFEDPSYDELPYARAVAEHLGVRHICETLTSDVLDRFHDLMYFLDDPIADTSIFPTFLVSRLARRDVTVALSGDGGDELFGGYEAYLADALSRSYDRVPVALRAGLIEQPVMALRPRPRKKGLVNKARRFVQGIRLPQELGHARWRLFTDGELQSRLFTDDVRESIATPIESHIADLFAAAGDRTPLGRSLYVDVRSYLCDNILAKVDRMSMATSLEVRVPLLDRELVELAFQVPDSLKVHRGRSKILLKRVAARHVPARCVYRPKEGFSTPVKAWLRGPLHGLLEEWLSDQRIRDRGLVRVETVRQLKSEYGAGLLDHSHVLWSLIVFEAWCDRWLGSSPALPASQLRQDAQTPVNLHSC